MKKRAFSFLLVLALLLSLVLSACTQPRTEERAMERLEEYAYAIDHYYKTPEKIYPLLTEAFRASMSRDEFIEAFNKERSYPYITPLYIYDPVITMDEDGMGGTAVYTQAARIIGMTYSVRFVYEDGDWYISDWDEFLDGSYLEKFEEIPYSIEWYYDFDKSEEN